MRGLLLELALLLARQNPFHEAIQNAEKVVALEPNNLQVLAGVVDIAHRAGHLEMAIQQLRRGLQLVPDLELRLENNRPVAGILVTAHKAA